MPSASFMESMIVLNLTKVGEGSVVLHTLSRGLGRRSFLVNVGRGRSMTLFQPLNILEGQITENRRSTLWRAGGLVALHPLMGLRSDLRKGCISMFLSEVLFKALKEGALEEGLYDWCVREILTLDAMQGDFANFHLKFLLELGAALGFAPQAADLLPFIPDGTAQVVMGLLDGTFAEAMLLPLKGSLRSEIAEGLLRYLSFHTESQLNIKSLEVLKNLI